MENNLHWTARDEAYLEEVIRCMEHVEKDYGLTLHDSMKWLESLKERLVAEDNKLQENKKNPRDLYCEKNCPEENSKWCAYYNMDGDKCYENKVFEEGWYEAQTRMHSILHEFVAPIKQCEQANTDSGMEAYLLGQIEAVETIERNLDAIMNTENKNQ